MYWLLFLISFAHAKKQKAPCWITIECAPYSSTEYLIGVGSGETLEQADNSAIGAISKQFVVNIQQTQISQKELSETTRQNQEISALEHQSLRTKTSVNTSMHLTGVKIAERFHEEKRSYNRHYSLAIISKEVWLQQILEERTEIRGQIDRILFEIQKTEHFLDRIPYYQKLYPLIALETGLLTQERIIAPDQGHFPVSTSKNLIQNQQSAERQQFYFVVEDNDSAAIVAQGLQNIGFSVQSSVSNPEAAISIRIEEERSISTPDTYGFITASSNIRLYVHTSSRKRLELRILSSSASRSAEKAAQKLDSAILSSIQDIQPKIEAILQGTQ